MQARYSRSPVKAITPASSALYPKKRNPVRGHQLNLIQMSPPTEPNFLYRPHKLLIPIALLGRSEVYSLRCKLLSATETDGWREGHGTCNGLPAWPGNLRTPRVQSFSRRARGHLFFLRQYLRGFFRFSPRYNTWAPSILAISRWSALVTFFR